MKADRFEYAVDEAIKERERHGWRASPSRSCVVKAKDE
jgi:hypothetical protein